MEIQTNTTEELKPLTYLKEKALRMDSKEFKTVFCECDLSYDQVESLCVLALVSLEYAEKHVGKDYKPLFTGEEVFEHLTKGF